MCARTRPRTRGRTCAPEARWFQTTPNHPNHPFEPRHGGGYPPNSPLNLNAEIPSVSGSGDGAPSDPVVVRDIFGNVVDNPDPNLKPGEMYL